MKSIVARMLQSDPVIYPAGRELDLVKLFEKKRIPPVFADILSFVTQQSYDAIEDRYYPLGLAVWSFVDTMRKEFSEFCKEKKILVPDETVISQFADQYNAKLLNTLAINTDSTSGQYLDASMKFHNGMSLAIRYVLQNPDLYRLYDIANSKIGQIFINDAGMIARANRTNSSQEAEA